MVSRRLRDPCFFFFFFRFLLTLWPQHSLSPVFWSVQVKELLYLEGTRDHLILIQSLYPASSTRGCPSDDHLSISRGLEGVVRVCACQGRGVKFEAGRGGIASPSTSCVSFPTVRRSTGNYYYLWTGWHSQEPHIPLYRGSWLEMCLEVTGQNPHACYNI